MLDDLGCLWRKLFLPSIPGFGVYPKQSLSLALLYHYHCYSNQRSFHSLQILLYIGQTIPPGLSVQKHIWCTHGWNSSKSDDKWSALTLSLLKLLAVVWVLSRRGLQYVCLQPPKRLLSAWAISPTLCWPSLPQCCVRMCSGDTL